MKARTLHIRHALFLCAFLFGIVGVSWGQTTYDWIDSAPDGNWKQGAGGARWNPGGLWDEPGVGIIRFNNNHRLSMTNNVTGPYNQFKIIFGSSNSSARTISGTASNSVRFADFSGSWPRIDNESSATHTINFPIIVNSGGTWNLELATNNSSTGKLIFGSNATISNNTSKILYIYGNSTTNSDRYIELDGVISGNGSLQVKLGGIARIGANHSYTGSTNIEHGELWIDNGGDLSSTSSINLGLSNSMSSVAKIFISDIDGGTTFTRNIIVSDGNASTRYIGGFNTIGTNYFSGTISRSATNNLTLEAVSSSGTVEFSNDISGSGQIIKIGLGTAVLSAANSYTGETIINEGTLQLNKTGGGTLPSTNSITVNNNGTLRISSNQTLNNLTINSGGNVLVDANVQLTVSGTLTNSGTLTLENGATLVQTGSNPNAGSGGTYNVKQEITGTSSGSAPNGRGWYIGSPVSGATSNLFAPSNSTNLIYHWNANQATPNWAPISAGSATTLDVGKGYAVRVGGPSIITFSSSTLNNAPASTPINIACYKQASTTYQGFNLVSNPFASYLDWNEVWTGTNATNFESTIHYRVANGSNVMVVDTYNALNGQGTANSTGLGSNTNGTYVTRYIPPMQAFWVRTAAAISTSTTAVNLSLDNSMRDHYTYVVNGWSAGLKSTAQDFPMFLRLNIEQGTFKDQMLVFLKPQASSQYDAYDSEKMFLSGYPQLYTQVSNRKLVFNGLNSNKKITVIPVIVDIPTAGLFTFRAEEFNVEAGLILLEDKQEGITQDLTINDAYTFYANAGTISNRFFIRFHQLDPSITAQGPSNSWVDDENEINEGGSIVVATNGRGKVTIQQDIDPLASDESDVTIRDAAGREVLSGKLSGLESVFQLDAPSGVYFVAVQLNGQVEVKKIFVQQ